MKVLAEIIFTVYAISDILTCNLFLGWLWKHLTKVKVVQKPQENPGIRTRDRLITRP